MSSPFPDDFPDFSTNLSYFDEPIPKPVHTIHKCGHAVNTAYPSTTQATTIDFLIPPAIHSPDLCRHCEAHSDFIISPAQHASMREWLDMLATVSTPEPNDNEGQREARVRWGAYIDAEKAVIESAVDMSKCNLTHKCGHVAIGRVWGFGEEIMATKCDACVERERKHAKALEESRGARERGWGGRR